MQEQSLKRIGNAVYDFSRSDTIYCNRSVVIPSDEEIMLALGVEDAAAPGQVQVLTRAYFTLPTFLRSYDSFKSVLDDFKKRGIYD